MSQTTILENATSPSLEEYRAMVKIDDCPNCGAPLAHGLKYYRHPFGEPVRGIVGLQWLFIECMKCDYDWALWKLGVPRTKL